MARIITHFLLLVSGRRHVLKKYVMTSCFVAIAWFQSAWFFVLTLNDLCISESCIEIKLSEIFIFILFCGASKGFMKAFRAFKNPFEATQRSIEIKI